MACLLIVDDDTDNALQLADVIAAQMPGVHQTVCIKALEDFRQLRRHYKPDLILVELLRLQSNGFTLAAAFARQSSVPVVLLTDRNIASDRLWAAARGIRHVMSRRSGQAALVQQIHKLLPEGRVQDDAGLPDEQGELTLIHKSQLAELTTSPEAALMACLCEDLRRLQVTTPVCGMALAANKADQLLWVKNLLVYISDGELRDALRLLLEPADGSRADLLQIRESLLFLMEPDAGAMLVEHCRDAWLQLGQMLHAEFSATHHCADSSAHHAVKLTSFINASGCRELLDALGFVPGLQEQVCALKACVDITAADFAERMQNLLDPAVAGDELRRLKDAEGRRVLLSRTAWRDLTSLCLMLRAVSEKQYWLPVLRHSVSGLYGWQNRLPEADSELLVYLTLSLLGSLPVNVSLNVTCKEQSQDPAGPGLSAESAHKLRCALDRMLDTIVRETSPYQRLSCLMVSIYKLRGWLEFGIADGHTANSGLQRWQQVAGCLYQLVCHGVLQPGLLTCSDFNVLHMVLSELRDCAGQGLLPPEDTLMNLAAVEIAVARRSQSGYGREHQLLAAGLHRLPKPDCIVPDMIRDIKQSGTVLSEITCELRMLTDGARRLGVGRVESLARLLLDCYEKLSSQPGLLQHKSLRLALGRAHRVLCRLLDQAAAWLPLDRSGAGLSLPSVIDELFARFDHPGGIADAAGDGSGQVAWLQCQSLNRRLRQLIRRSDNLSDYRSLMIELLQEQQAVITPYLPYQSTE